MNGFMHWITTWLCDLYEAKLFESKFLSDKAEPVRFGLSEAYKENLRRDKLKPTQNARCGCGIN